MAFDFESKITGRTSILTHEITCPLYEKKEFSIKVENKFLTNPHGEFSITIIHEFEIKDKPEEVKKKVPKEKGDNK